MKLEELPWDSQFFGFKIGRLVFDGSEEVPAVMRRASADGFRCIYCLAGCKQARGLEGFDPIEVCAEMAAEVNPDGQTGDFDMSPATASDVEDLVSASRGAFSLSRFYSDGRFAKAECDELYSRWVARDCTEKDRLTVVAESGGRLAGFWSVSLGEDSANTGLTFVHPDFRGQGVPSAMFGFLSRLLAGRGIKDLTIATQGSNVAAVRAYLKCGFRFVQTRLWLHAWL